LPGLCAGRLLLSPAKSFGLTLRQSVQLDLRWVQWLRMLHPV